MDVVGIYVMSSWSILRQFGIFYGHLVYLFPFRYVVPRKIWQPCSAADSRHIFEIEFALRLFACHDMYLRWLI
jgi:hypothetical protein